MIRRAAAIAGLACCTAAATGLAQSSGLDPLRESPLWMRSWSALVSLADLARELPGTGTALSAMTFGAPRIGGFWTGGNPAGLVDGVPDARSDFTFGWSRQRGGYRRPLDPGATRLLQAGAQAWKRLSPASSMIGRVGFDQERLDPGTEADATVAFGSSPLVTVDTSAASVRRTRAVLEGAAGWKSGPWGVGLTLGFEARDHASLLSGVTRLARGAMPGVVVGVTRRLGGFELGTFGRLRHRSEEIRVFERSGQARVYQLTGYGEATPIDLVEPYFRRTEENAGALGLSLSGASGRFSWTAAAAMTQLRSRLWRQRVNDPDRDRWDASGWEARAALQRSIGEPGLLTVQAGIVSLRGEADLVTDSAGVIFTADERRLEVEAEWRLVPGRSPWSGAVTLGLKHERRIRNDLAVSLGTAIRTTTSSLAVEVGRRAGRRMIVTVGGAISLYGPTTEYPNPANRGLVYQKYLAPELELYAANSTSVAWSALLQYRSGNQAILWLRGRTERLSPSDAVSLPAFRPGGNRMATSLAGGVTLR